MSIETPTSGLPPVVPFADQHQRQPDTTTNGVPWGRCSCGVRWKPTRGATSPWERHLRRAATLTDEQCRVLSAANDGRDGLLPGRTSRTTTKPLIERGLIVEAAEYPGQAMHRITGRGRGVLAEHRRRFA